MFHEIRTARTGTTDFFNLVPLFSLTDLANRRGREWPTSYSIPENSGKLLSGSDTRLQPIIWPKSTILWPKKTTCNRKGDVLLLKFIEK